MSMIVHCLTRILSQLREEFSQVSYQWLQIFLVCTCSALLAAWLAQSLALASGQRDITYGGAIWTAITFVLMAALINLRDVHKSRMYWLLKQSRKSKQKRSKEQKWATPMVPVAGEEVSTRESLDRSPRVSDASLRKVYVTNISIYF